MNNNRRANLDKYGFPLNAPITQGIPPQSVVPWVWGQSQKIQTKQVKLSRSNIKNFIQNSNIAFAIGTIANGTGASFTSTLTQPPPHQNEPNFAVIYTALYQGTVRDANQQLYPYRGGSTGAGTNFVVQGGLDYHLYDGTNSNFTGYIYNNSGAIATISLWTEWKMLVFNSGTTVSQ